MKSVDERKKHIIFYNAVRCFIKIKNSFEVVKFKIQIRCYNSLFYQINPTGNGIFWLYANINGNEKKIVKVTIVIISKTFQKKFFGNFCYCWHLAYVRIPTTTEE